MKITLGNTLPPYPDFVEGIRRAPDRGYTLTPAQTITALKNALRYTENSRPWLHTCSGAGQVISGGNFHDLSLAISYDFL